MRVISSTTSSTASCELSLAGAPLRLRADKRARRLRLRLDARRGGLTLTVPAGVSRRRALAWAAGHEDWAREAVGRQGKATALVPGASVPFLGAPHRIDWSAEQSRRVVREEGRLVCGGPAENLEGRILRWMRGEALALLGAETLAMARDHKLKVERVSVGDPHSRWGSCSSGGAIRYSWRLIMAPDFVRRATVAHEIAHLVHMNHGAHFHALVAQLLQDDPAPARAWLRRHGAALHRIGAV
jgi:predicted metal-dependent hydrolase